MPEASKEITRKAKSNLAIALGVLPKDKRRDATTFYAYCRSIDDLADNQGIPEDDRRRALAAWKLGLLEGFEQPDPLQREVADLQQKQQLPIDLLLAIIEGCEMDLDQLRYESQKELDGYIWKVSCAVGLICIRLFGCSSSQSEAYAESLGRALQLTNILRDVGEDLHERNRIYLPLEDLRRFGCSEEALLNATRDHSFLKLMEFHADKAQNDYEEARSKLPNADRRALRPALIMADIYQKLLCQMRQDGFQVFDRRYRVGKLSKLFIGLRHLWS